MYTMERQKNPGVIVLDGDGNRVSSDHYTVSYQAGRKKVGQYHVNVKMKNKYCGSKTLSFKIVPKATKITKVIKKKKALSIFWKKTEKAGVRISDSGINKQKIQIKKDKKYQWYEKEQYYGIQVKIQKEIIISGSEPGKRKNRKKILFCLVKS